MTYAKRRKTPKLTPADIADLESILAHMRKHHAVIRRAVRFREDTDMAFDEVEDAIAMILNEAKAEGTAP